ncbi:DMT family transporter [Roseateles oligotrophus]|uniref:DMT family transporter n=1 Tax=Roseateles oligotrophus TaxID=1769250 RepID=A0ABT2YLV4_9BURK|nr:DMT family transporter [Roseateles oligotrophus]MCV2371031.1 DMT family transporter [Roseateles oligotrophus]
MPTATSPDTAILHTHADQTRAAPRSGAQLELLGWAALALTLCIWAAFFISLRAGARAALPPAELALLRFGPAGLLFMPLLWRRRARFAQVSPKLWLLIVAGAGLPYFLIAGWGMRHAPVADGATLIPGTLPLFTALLAAALHGRAALARWPALLCIAAGIATMLALKAGQAGLAEGYAMFLLGSLMWSAYTLALRQAKLAPIEAAALISSVSLLLLLPVLAWQASHGGLSLPALPREQLWLQLLIQSVGVGLISTLSYSVAVARLGAQRSAMAGALTPVLATLLALPLFGERPDLATIVGMLLIAAGVLWGQRKA